MMSFKKTFGLILKTVVCLLMLSLSLEINAKGAHATKFGGSLNAARERAVRENKLLILEFTAKWCLPCRYMEKNVFMNPEVLKFSESRAIIYQIDIDENKNLKDEYKIEVLPTLILMNEAGEIIAKKEESLNAESFMTWLEKHEKALPDQENILTLEQTEETPIAIVVPDLESREMEAEISKQVIAESNTNNNTLYVASKASITGFHIQAGVFSNRLNAENMVALLQLNFEESIHIDEETRDELTFYKVNLGNFSTREKAEQFRLILEKNKVKAVIKPN